MDRRARPEPLAVEFVPLAEFRRRGRAEAELADAVEALPALRRRRAGAEQTLPTVDRITVVEGEDGSATVLLPDLSPTAVRQAVDAAAAAGQMARLAGKTVDIASADPALVAAFVYAAKPWLRWFSVAGRVIVPAPTK